MGQQLLTWLHQLGCLHIFAKNVKMMKGWFILTILLLLTFPKVFGQQVADTLRFNNQELSANKPNDISVSTQIFLGYRYFIGNSGSTNEFTVKRGYINFIKSLNKNISGRITPDITLDREGDGQGDMEMRLKYCYMKLEEPGDFWIFTNPAVFIGEVFTPWIEFEEKINPYRIQGNHFLEKSDILISADFGVMAAALLGGTLNEGYQTRVGSDYPGRYGSLAIGVYNGGGYHNIEENNNKTLQYRLTLRPLPDMIPGLQLSYTGATGKGNTTLSPDWNTNVGVLSYQGQPVTLCGQVFSSVGNYSGSLADTLGVSYKVWGWSAFVEFKLLRNRLSIFGRYDYVKGRNLSEFGNITQSVVGVAYSLFRRNKLVVDYSRNESSGKVEEVIEFMVELAF